MRLKYATSSKLSIKITDFFSFLYHPKILKYTQTTTAAELDSTKEKYVTRSEKGYKIIEFPLRMTFTKI